MQGYHLDIKSCLKDITRLALGLVVLLCLSACNSTTLVYDLDQKQATEIVGVLNSHGIAASSTKDSGGRSRFSVQVNRKQRTAAIAILNDKGLPTHSRFSELVQEHGLLPNSRDMEALKADYASAQEIREMLEGHPAILSANVVLRDRYPRENKKPSLSAIIQKRSGVELQAESIANLIGKLNPEMVQENIQVSIYDAEAGLSVVHGEGADFKGGKVVKIPLTSVLMGWRVADDDFAELTIFSVILIIAVAFFAGAIGYWYGFYLRADKSEGTLAHLSQTGSSESVLDTGERKLLE